MLILMKRNVCVCEFWSRKIRKLTTEAVYLKCCGRYSKGALNNTSSETHQSNVWLVLGDSQTEVIFVIVVHFGFL